MNAFKNNPKIKNFFEGMACKGGCLNGPLNLRHNQKILADIDRFGNKAINKDPNESCNKFKKNLV